MTKEEFKTLVKAMKAVYTHPSFIPDKYAFEVWYSMLKDLDYQTASAAIQKHMQSEEREPTVASIRKHAEQINGGLRDEIGEMQAWSMAYRAISDSAYHADERFAELPETIQRAVASPGNLREWGQMDAKTVNSVIQSQFLRSYRAEVKRAADLRKLSPDLLKLTGIVMDKLPRAEKKAIPAEERGEGVPAPEGLMDEIRERLSAKMGKNT